MPHWMLMASSFCTGSLTRAGIVQIPSSPTNILYPRYEVLRIVWLYSQHISIHTPHPIKEHLDVTSSEVRRPVPLYYQYISIHTPHRIKEPLDVTSSEVRRPVPLYYQYISIHTPHPIKEPLDVTSLSRSRAGRSVPVLASTCIKVGTKLSC